MAKKRVQVKTGKVDNPATPTVDESLVDLEQGENESDEDFALRVQEAEANAQQDGESDEDYAARMAEVEVAAKLAATAKAKADAEAAAKASELAGYTATAATAAAVAERERKAKLDLVTVVVPKQFKLTLDNHEVIAYRDGTYEMPRSHANHWYAKASGVTIYEAPK